MKKGYLVGYVFNRYNTLESCCFLVQTNDKKVAQAVAKKWCAFGMFTSIIELLLARLPKIIYTSIGTPLAIFFRGID